MGALESLKEPEAFAERGGSGGDGVGWLGNAVLGALSSGVTPEGQGYQLYRPESNGSRGTQQSLPPNRAELLARYQESPVDRVLEKSSGTGKFLKMLGAYVALPVVTTPLNRIASLLGLDQTPEEYFSEDILSLLGGVSLYGEAEKLLLSPDFANNAIGISAKLSEKLGWQRQIEAKTGAEWRRGEAAGLDDSVSKKMTPAERLLVGEVATTMLEEGVGSEEIEGVVESEAMRITAELGAKAFGEKFVQEEKSRAASVLAKAMKEKKNKVIFEVGPWRAVGASLLAGGKGFGRAFSSLLFKHEAKKRGIQIRLLQKPEVMGGMTFQILTGGMPESVKNLPVAAPEWRQGPLQSVFSDTGLGWLVRKLAFFGDKNMEIGILRLEDPREAYDYAEIPVAVTTSAKKDRLDPNPSGGSAVMEMALVFISEASKILKKNPPTGSLRLRTQSRNVSLENALENARSAILDEAVRPEVVLKYATDLLGGLEERTAKERGVSVAGLRLANKTKTFFKDLMKGDVSMGGSRIEDLRYVERNQKKFQKVMENPDDYLGNYERWKQKRKS